MEVSRSALRSQSPSPPTSPEIDRESILAQFNNLEYEVAPQNDSKIHASYPSQPAENLSEDGGLEFRLFAPTVARPKTKTSSKEASNSPTPQPQTTKIRFRSPSPDSGKPGFLRPHRNPSYYFATPPSGQEAKRKKTEFVKSAISTAKIQQLSRRHWTGVAYPWKVLHVNSLTGLPQAPMKNAKAPTAAERFSKVVDPALLAEEVNGGKKKRTRPSKACRLRRRKGVARVRDEAERKRAEREAKEVAEREKRTRLNRNKKVRRRLKEKAGKADAGIEDGEVEVVGGADGHGGEGGN